jgi:hypothetical protein
LQNGHRSAERKKTSIVPFGPLIGFQGLSPTFLVLGRKIRHPVSNRRAGLDVLAVKHGKREQSTKYKIALVSLSPRFANSLASERPPD